MADFLNTFVNDLKSNLSGFVAVAVTEVKTGMSYVSNTLDPSFDPELASAYNLEVVKAKLNAIRALKLNEKIDDILITLNSQIHIINLAENGEYFVYLAVDSNKANLGMARATLRKYTADIAAKL
ncbi:hypothetical protein [Aestuariibaculum marinum]|uniref:Roadblock/LAMTOR2 domain-containing protein n=1 Tax=Aestuariibaculum marinum TaxID=2683592 RepID=A0A8J6U7V2_9FLAO|nr:hypothetical protein [Aestuariibaculum marinum]MBD0823286.1 hypothetical protein [Aestuariibaculum marinum]